MVSNYFFNDIEYYFPMTMNIIFPMISDYFPIVSNYVSNDIKYFSALELYLILYKKFV